MVLEKTLESPSDSKEIKPVNPKGNKLWIFIGRTDAGAEAPIFWPPDMKSWLTGKDPVGKDDGKHWRQKEKRVAQDEIVRQCHWLSAYEFEQTLGDSEGQGSLACCSQWGHKELDTCHWTTTNTLIQEKISRDFKNILINDKENAMKVVIIRRYIALISYISKE